MTTANMKANDQALVNKIENILFWIDLLSVVPHSKYGFRIYVLDMLVHCLTGKPDIEYLIRALAQHVLRFLHTVGVRRADLAGQALGGRMTLGDLIFTGTLAGVGPVIAGDSVIGNIGGLPEI